MLTDPKVIVALDFDNQKQVEETLNLLSPSECKVKIGKELFTRFGPKVVKLAVDAGFQVFLDLKFHDIPNTVAKACIAAADLGVWMINVHASGGAEMMHYAKTSLESAGHSEILLTAVTVLTSMDQQQLDAVFPNVTPEQQVTRLASLAHESGLDGVVCSAVEAPVLRKMLSSEFKLVTPGIRPAGSGSDDQKRIVTPKLAVENGVDYLVIGRPITQANSPLDALKSINASIGGL